MPYQIDKLLKEDKYDIYNNANVKEEDIKKLAEVISENKHINLNEYFDLLKCSSKFCWLNFLKILENLSDEDKERELPLLFVLLQDSNWPTYQKTIQLFEKMDKDVIIPHLKKYLAQAYEEDDDMWIFNLQLLAQKLNIDY